MRIARNLAAAAVCLTACILPDLRAQDSAGGPLASAIDFARPRVVKLYGDAAGREHGYGVGVIVSADGKIATTTAVMLESAGLRAVLNDGRRFPAKVIARDETHQLALLQIDGDQLPAFELGTSETMQPGDWVLTAGNPFKVADGPEPVSFMRGVFSGRADLAARRRAQDVAYPGQVLLLDAIVSTPGQAGGALVDSAGRLVGLIGKSVESTRTNTFLNYAIPVETVADFVSAAASGKLVESADPTAEHTSLPPADLGIRVFDVSGPERPALVERVRPDSPARRAGVRVNDQILSLGGVAVGTCGEYADALKHVTIGQKVEMIVQRGDETLVLELVAGARP